MLAGAVEREVEAFKRWVAPQLIALVRRHTVQEIGYDLHAVGAGIAAHVGDDARRALAPLLLPAKELADVSSGLLPEVGVAPAITLSPSGVQQIVATHPVPTLNLDTMGVIAPDTALRAVGSFGRSPVGAGVATDALAMGAVQRAVDAALNEPARP